MYRVTDSTKSLPSIPPGGRRPGPQGVPVHPRPAEGGCAAPGQEEHQGQPGGAPEAGDGAVQVRVEEGTGGDIDWGEQLIQ